MAEYYSKEKLLECRKTTGYDMYDLDDFLTEVPTADVVEVAEWISVKDNLPEIGIEVLGYSEKEDKFCVVVYSDTYRCFFSGQFPNDNITHWMPLPCAPQKEVSNGVQ